MSMLLPILRLAAEIVLFVVLLFYVLGPVLVRFTLKQPIAPAFQPVQLEGLPPEAQDFLSDAARRLAPLGFEPAQTCVLLQKDIGTILMLLVHREARDTAMATAMYVRITAGQDKLLKLLRKTYVEFCTEFSDDSELCTNNSPELGTFPQAPDKQVCQLPHVKDADALHGIHQEMLRRRKTQAAKVIPEPGRELEHLREGWARDLERQAERGYLVRSERQGVYRATWKGALLMTWKLLWPVSAVRRSRLRREAEAAARSVRELS